MNQASKKSDSGINDGACVYTCFEERRFFGQTAEGRSGADGGRPQLIN